MNIIQAIQAAENGAIITNNFLKLTNTYLMYIDSGVFTELHFNNNDNKFYPQGNIDRFNMAEILSTGWETYKQ